MTHILESPYLYQAFQALGGFYGARIKAFDSYLDVSNVKRIFDIGCGPGHFIRHIPDSAEYVGFDVDPRYIEFANRHFGERGKFVVRLFDRSATDDYGQPDLILMNGVLHHLDEKSARTVIQDSAAILPQHGVFFALDACHRIGQHPISRYLIDNDRGTFVRDEQGYRDLAKSAFPEVDVFVREDLSWVPYTFAITRATKVAKP
ncbi:Methyltransferase domain-containing protein [Rhizobiales bacterium GAS191]|nr:Methyltransferase domain-containing protein [Rhizobiales bacterium GAS191]